MVAPADPRSSWRSGFAVLAVVPFIGLALTFAHPPTWLQILGVVVMVALVGTGSSMMRRRGHGWRPSETLAPTRTDEH
jgi:hypothetical protein